MKVLRFIIALCSVTSFAGLWLSSCHNGRHESFSRTEEEKADSIVRRILRTDSLLTWKAHFQAEGNREGEMVVWRHLGRRFREQNQFMKAIEAHTTEWELATEMGDTISMIQALNNIGTCHRRMSLLDEASRYHYHALRLCETFSDQQSYGAQKNRVVSLNGIGNISLRIGDDQTADSVFRAALAGETRLNSALGQAINYANIGAIFEKNGMTDSAWAYYRQSMQKNEEAQSALGIALCYGHFGDLYLKEGEPEKAIAEYEKAYRMKEETDTWHWLNSALALAKVHSSQGYTQKALNLLKEAEQGAIEGRAMDHLADIYTLYSEIYHQTGRPAQALEAYRMSRSYQDSIVNNEKMMVLQNERVRYEYERRQKEIDTIQAHYEKEKVIRNIFAIAMGVILILAIIIFLQMRNTLRMKEKEKELLKQLDHVRASFFTNITHEFRTPLTVIIGLGEKIRDNLLPDESGFDWPSMGQMIVKQGKDILQLINQMLEIAKARSAQPDKPCKRGDLIGYLSPIIEYAHVLAEKKSIKLMFLPHEPEIEMDFVPDYITQIMGNLLSNAIKFTPENGHIHVRIRKADEKHVSISVADNGTGIAPGDLPYIFDAFYQGANSQGTTGTGIGLSLTKQQVEAMNGTIGVRSHENQGSEFTITLPLEQPGGNWERLTDKADISPEEEEQEMADTTEETPDEMPRILIVEDNRDIALFMQTIIPHAHLHFAKNGQEGLEKATTLMPDLIVTDIMMPVMDGLEMCRAIRQSETLNRIPIIVITAKISEEDRIEGLKAGADAYLTKPFSEEELNITIQALLNRCKVMQENKERNERIEEGGESKLSTNEQLFLNTVVDIIHNQMAQQKVNINDLSAALFISPKQLNRRINAITGENISKYILRIRMVKAKQLLDSDKNYTIAEVALKCGYDENSNFTRAFKLYYNITPTQYRKTNV